MTWKFNDKKIAIVGDLMLDKYVFGQVERISPEAPVQVVSVSQEKFTPGGAANTAANIATLEGKAFLFGVTGTDSAAEQILLESRKLGIEIEGVIREPLRKTTQKIRVIGQSQQLLRIDYEEPKPISSEAENKICQMLQAQKTWDAVIISDYAKGGLTESMIATIKAWAAKQKIPVLVDPKPQHASWYNGVYLITPNRKEAEAILGARMSSPEEIDAAGRTLCQRLDTNVLITLGEKGMSLFEKSGKVTYTPTVARQVYDVSGAGDTVIAAMALAIAAGSAPEDAARFANQAAGVKVGKLGTAPVKLSEIQP